MKKILALSLALLMVVAVFAACNTPTATEGGGNVDPATKPGETDSAGMGETKPAGGNYKFGYTCYTMNNPFFVFIENVMKDQLRDGDTLSSLDPNQDVQKQANQIEDMVMQGNNVIFIHPVDSSALRSSCELAKSKGVFIVNFDSPLIEADQELVDCIVQSNNETAGYVCGQQMVEDFPAGGTFFMIASPSGESARLRMVGVDKALEELAPGKWEKVYEQDGKGSTQDTLPVVENGLQASTPTAIWCVNDPSAIGAVAALKAANKLDQVAVYGVDGAPEGKKAIVDGEMYGTGAQSPYNIGVVSMQMAYKLLDGEEIENFNTLIPCFIINRDNINDYGVDTWQ